MRKFILPIGLLMGFFSFTACDSAKGGDKITLDNSVVIDVRTAGEFQMGHLNNALNIPYDQIQFYIGEAVGSKDAKITVYCRSGRRSGIAKSTLNKMGYENVWNGGAFVQLKRLEN